MPTGKYGRCGSIISRASFGTTMRPEPNGQMPAIARNSVDLPEPDGPVTSTGSPRGHLDVVGRHQRRCRSAGSPRRSSSSTARPSPVASTSITGGVCAAALRRRHGQARNPSRRWMTDRHSASERYTLMKNDSAVCTLLKADAVCISPPSCILPAK